MRGRVELRAGRSRLAPTHRGRLSASRRSLTAAGVLPTYELNYGSRLGLRFYQAAEDAGFAEMTGSWWPTEEKSLLTVAPAEGEPVELRTIFRDGETEAVYELAEDGTLVWASIGRDSMRVQIAAPTAAAAEAALLAFQAAYPASFVNTEGDSRVPVTFWSFSAHGPIPRLRRIEATPWEPVASNYTQAIADDLGALMAWVEPQAEGQLILWQGPPGTGKTWALRALAYEWRSWAEFHYITDPDSFFVDEPSYMVDVLLSESYSVVDSDGDVYEEDPAGKWRILILEDTGELLSANAKEKYGQGLSRLLNVVDGMIGQGLRVLCLVTTNDELGDLNEAVRRPGRCAQQLVFSPLTDDEAQAWTGDPTAISGTLAELYSKYGRAPAEAFADDDLAELVEDAYASIDVRSEPIR